MHAYIPADANLSLGALMSFCRGVLRPLGRSSTVYDLVLRFILASGLTSRSPIALWRLQFSRLLFPFLLECVPKNPPSNILSLKGMSENAEQSGSRQLTKIKQCQQSGPQQHRDHIASLLWSLVPFLTTSEGWCPRIDRHPEWKP